MNELDRIFQNTKTSTSFALEYMQYLNKVMLAVNVDEIADFITLLLNARNDGSQIIFMGNGGSAATASHFSNDIAIGTRTLGKPFRAISITDNMPVITAIANDDGFDEVFVQQLKIIMKQGDIVVAISASGGSKNIIKAIDYATKSGNTTVGITAFNGGELKEKAEHSIHVPTNLNEYGPAEDVHMILDHLVSAYLMRIIKNDSM